MCMILQVTAVVFYGRRQVVRIMNAYLERNLVQNGGVLYKVRLPLLQRYML